MANEQPVWKLSQGALSVAAWKNTVSINGNEVDRLSVRVERRYKDREDRWQSTNSYSISELMRLHRLLGRAIDGLLEMEASERGEAA